MYFPLYSVLYNNECTYFDWGFELGFLLDTTLSKQFCRIFCDNFYISKFYLVQSLRISLVPSMPLQFFKSFKSLDIPVFWTIVVSFIRLRA
jgi:hypothetical protein